MALEHGAQIPSALMIAAFFLALARSLRRVELRPWTQAWLANLVALLATVEFWFLQPDSLSSPSTKSGWSSLR